MADKTWVKGQPSRYQLHDLVHFPDWKNIIVWDAFFNNLTSGLMVVIFLTWLSNFFVFNPVLPWALTLAFVIVIFDLLLLIGDLGDHIRFLHAMRVFHPTSPLSVGVIGLIFYSIMLFIACVFCWLCVLAVNTGFWAPALPVFDVIVKIFTFLSFVGACVVICYKGVVFSCTSQPGVKHGRWLTAWMVADAMLMGLALYILLCFALGYLFGMGNLVMPLLVMIVFRCVTYGLLNTNLKDRAPQVYSKEFIQFNPIMVYGLCGVAPFLLAFAGPFGVTLGAIIVLIAGVWERYWVVGMARHR